MPVDEVIRIRTGETGRKPSNLLKYIETRLLSPHFTWIHQRFAFDQKT